MLRTLIVTALMCAAGTLEAQTKEAGEIGRRYSPDASRPAPLTPTSQYQRDRASFADVSMPASIRAAQQRIEPRRPAPAPFAPASLPDPFEHRRVMSFGGPLPEPMGLPLILTPPTK